MCCGESVPVRPKQRTMGAGLGETRPFACSCLPFPGTTKANQRSPNGGWQASTNAFPLCLGELTPLLLSIFQLLLLFNIFLRTVQTFLTAALTHCCRLIPQRDVWVKGWPQVLSVLADTTRQYCDTNNLHYLFISSRGLLKGINCTVAVFCVTFSNRHLKAISNFRVLIENKICIKRWGGSVIGEL